LSPFKGEGEGKGVTVELLATPNNKERKVRRRLSAKRRSEKNFPGCCVLELASTVAAKQRIVPAADTQSSVEIQDSDGSIPNTLGSTHA